MVISSSPLVGRERMIIVVVVVAGMPQIRAQSDWSGQNMDTDSRASRISRMTLVVSVQGLLWLMVLLSYTGGGSTTFEDFSQIAYKPSLPHGLGWKLSNLTRAARGWYAMSDDEQLVRFEIGLTHHTVETDGVRKTESAGDSCTNDVKRYSSLYGNATIPRGALGLITQTFGKYSLALAKRRNRGNATKWKYEIEDIDVEQSACMNLLFAYLSGTTALAASTASSSAASA